jgi:hypothetical protein
VVLGAKDYGEQGTRPGIMGVAERAQGPFARFHSFLIPNSIKKKK